VRTTVNLDEDVYRAVKALAARSGRPIGRVLSDLVRRALSVSLAGSHPRRLPTFSVGEDAELILTERAAEILAAEGL